MQNGIFANSIFVSQQDKTKKQKLQGYGIELKQKSGEEEKLKSKNKRQTVFN